MAALASPGDAWAWGADAHRLIAGFAAEHLEPSARLEVDRLLALEPGQTLVSISTWADEVRSPATAAWHYLNFPADGSCQYDAQRLCPMGSCAVGAIERQLAVLASRAPDERRLLALKWVVHLTADLHQPLHAGLEQDRGGNKHQLQAWGRGTNLHALWDTGLIQRWPGGLQDLREAMNRAQEPHATGDPRRWAEESCALLAQAGFYPDTRSVGEAYMAESGPRLAQQLAAAGRRLAAVLNEAFAGSTAR